MSTFDEIQTFRCGRDMVLPGGVKVVQPTASGDWPLIEGRDSLQAAQIRRAVTAAGEMVHRPLYGGDLPLFVETGADPATLARMAVGIRQNALRDDRVAEVTVTTAEETSAEGRIRVDIEITPRGEDTPETVTVVLE